MAVQCLHPRIEAGAAAGSPTFPFFDDGGGCDTILALQRLQSQLARLDRERHEADACAAALREDIAARELELARLAAEADAADASDDGADDGAVDEDDEATLVEAATAAEAELRRAEDRRGPRLRRPALLGRGDAARAARIPRRPLVDRDERARRAASLGGRRGTRRRTRPRPPGPRTHPRPPGARRRGGLG